MIPQKSLRSTFKLELGNNQHTMLIALGKSNDDICYLAPAKPMGDQQFMVSFMASSLVLDKVRLKGAQEVQVQIVPDTWACGMLRLLPKDAHHNKIDESCVALCLEISQILEEGPSSIEIRLQT